jgi:tripartite-type tricarboxylate transporter receptor subunit TctC
VKQDKPEAPRRPRTLITATALLAAAVLVIGCSSGPGASGAGDYPNRTINFIVPFAAGGPTDTVTRLIADPMGRSMGQQIVVQNVAGAGGTLAAGQVATATADGYTVLMHHIGMSTAPSLYANLAYDPLTDFKMIGLVTEVPMTIIGGTEFEPETLEELVAYVKEHGEDVNYAMAGVGAASHLCGLLFQSAVDAKVTEVTYEGTGPGMTALVGNQVDFMCDQTTNTTEQINSGTVKAYAVTTPERNDALPDVPTATEAGLEGMEVTVWHGLYVPADTPDAIVAKLTEELKKALKDPTVIERFGALGTTPVAEDQATPEAHRQKLQSQIDLWKPIIEAAGVSAG